MSVRAECPPVLTFIQKIGSATMFPGERKDMRMEGRSNHDIRAAMAVPGQDVPLRAQVITRKDGTVMSMVWNE